VSNSGLWTEVADLVAILRKRWNSGRYLRAFASGEPWESLTLSVKAPTATDLLEHLEAARDWRARFERDSQSAGRAKWTVEYRTIQSRHLGSNQVPARVVIESLDQLCRLLGTAAQVRSLNEMLERTGEEVPELLPWLRSHPLVAVEHAVIWPDLLATVAWIRDNEDDSLYLRHIDVSGVDTKFVENNQRLLTRLLEATLPSDQRESLPASSDFARRFGYRSRPYYTRLRLLDPTDSPFPPGVTEIALRTDELAQVPLPARRIFVVENEVSYLAFPAVEDAVVVFGSGFALTNTLDLPWLAAKDVVYWGDIDTYGFDILDRLRSRLAHVTSILMDPDTLIAHRRQWVLEPSPTNRQLAHLTPEECALYTDLVEDRYGHHVRLEQERVRFGLVRRTVSVANLPAPARHRPRVS
jgi:hypothetical protein